MSIVRNNDHIKPFGIYLFGLQILFATLKKDRLQVQPESSERKVGKRTVLIVKNLYLVFFLEPQNNFLHGHVGTTKGYIVVNGNFHKLIISQFRQRWLRRWAVLVKR